MATTAVIAMAGVQHVLHGNFGYVWHRQFPVCVWTEHDLTDARPSVAHVVAAWVVVREAAKW